MADVKISALPAATTPLVGTELVPIVQSGTTSRVSVDNLTAGKTVAASTVNVDANTASAAVRITQTGAGNALLVEDSANPDATPFVVDAVGRVLIAHTDSVATQTGATNLQIFGQASLQRYAANSFASTFDFVKSRNATFGQQTVVNNGDALGTVSFAGSDGTAFISGATISAAVDGAPGANDMPGRLVFSTTLDGAASPTERMRITNAGNVGIGTASPAGRLDVAGTLGTVQINANGDQISYNKNGFNYITASGASATLQIQATGAGGVLAFATGVSERMRITATGNVVAGGSVALATTATDGFLYVPTCAGVPTGTPTAITGMAPVVVNTTNNKLYFYSGGAWRDAGP